MHVFPHYQHKQPKHFVKVVHGYAFCAYADLVIDTESFWAYVNRITGGVQNREIAAAIGVDSSSISRWRTGEQPRVKNVIAFARAFNRPAVEALIAAGYLNISDAYSHVELRAAADLTGASDEELTAELQRRLKQGKPTPDL